MKIFYKNDSTEIRRYSFETDPIPDTAIFLNRKNGDFVFKADTQIIKIYFDKEFKNLAVNTLLIKEGEINHSKRYDRKGTLRYEWLQKGSGMKIYKRWYSNGKLCEVWHYENGNHVSDSTYYDNGQPENITLYKDNETFKRTDHTKTGKLISEMFQRIPKKSEAKSKAGVNAAQFLIEYDTITNYPNMCFLKNIIETYKTREGIEITTSRYIKIPIDDAILKTRNK